MTRSVGVASKYYGFSLFFFFSPSLFCDFSLHFHGKLDVYGGVNRGSQCGESSMKMDGWRNGGGTEEKESESAENENGAAKENGRWGPEIGRSKCWSAGRRGAAESATVLVN